MRWVEKYLRSAQALGIRRQHALGYCKKKIPARWRKKADVCRSSYFYALQIFCVCIDVSHFEDTVAVYSSSRIPCTLGDVVLRSLVHGRQIVV